MPYVNIPESQLGGIVSAQVGKLQGVVMSKVLKKVNEIIEKLKQDGCPTTSKTDQLRKQLNQIKNLLEGVNTKLNKFKALPKKLQAPISGLSAALKLILILPIPQAVPPGIGLPVSITTKYADLLHLLKELLKQIDENVTSINVALETPALSLKSLTRLLSQADIAIRTCELENALKDELGKGNISQSQLEDLGLFDGEFITSNLGPRLLSDANDTNFKGIWTSDGRQCYKVNDRIQIKEGDSEEYSIYVATEDHCSNPNTQPPKGPWKKLSTSIQEAINTLNTNLQSIQDSNISEEGRNNLKSVLDKFKPTQDTTTFAVEDNIFSYTSLNGEVYNLEILKDPTSPDIAPRRYAVARDQKGIIVMKGPPSFSSDTQVLLDEIKFRIDNQLP